MPAVLVLVVFVNSADVRAAPTIALERAAEEVLGADARVSVQGYGTPPSDAELAEKSATADVVAELVWQDEAHRHALVHCYVSKLHRFVNRELTFEDQDELGERGRLIGFALASMAPERAPERASERAPEREAGEAEERKPESAPTLPVPAPPAPAASVSEAATSEKPARRAPVAAIDATVLSAVGLGGPATGLGVGLGARWFFLPRLALRLGTGVRHGEIPNAQADSEFFFGAAGFAFLFSNPDSSTPFTLGGRADLLLISNSLRHRSSDDAIPVHQSRIMGGADLLLEGRWYFWRQAGLLLNGGGELAFGDTNVVVRGREVADIPALRLVAELGIVANF